MTPCSQLSLSSRAPLRTFEDGRGRGTSVRYRSGGETEYRHRCVPNIDIRKTKQSIRRCCSQQLGRADKSALLSGRHAV